MIYLEQLNCSPLNFLKDWYLMLNDSHQYKSWLINYEAEQLPLEEIIYHKIVEIRKLDLPKFWRAIYIENMSRSVELCRVVSGSFAYVFDDYDTMVAQGRITDDEVSESRLVVAYGQSAPPALDRKVDDRRLKGWLGPTEQSFGRSFDKGHFIAHSIGGAVDGAEFNVFIQLRTINRGWSEAGKRYRKMETYCKNHPGVFCFSRPFYSDTASRPSWVEFGVLQENGNLWVEVFENR